jgi:hypothetical protein
MIIFGHTPQEWVRRAKLHKGVIIACVVSFILGAVIF